MEPNVGIDDGVADPCVLGSIAGMSVLTRPGVRVTRTRRTPAHEQGSSDLVHLIAKIAQDFEQLDSLIESQRQMLQTSAGKGEPNAAEARRQMKRIRASAADVANRARETINDLDQPASGA